MGAWSILKAKMNHADFFLPNPTQTEIHFTEPTKVLQNKWTKPLLTRTKSSLGGGVCGSALKLDQNKTYHAIWTQEQVYERSLRGEAVSETKNFLEGMRWGHP